LLRCLAQLLLALLLLIVGLHVAVVQLLQAHSGPLRKQVCRTKNTGNAAHMLALQS
jgi:hypothetical protein